MLIRKKESDTYLAAVSRHHWSRQITMKIAIAMAESYNNLSIFIMICLLQRCRLTVAR